MSSGKSTSLTKHKRDWDELGRVDPLWAILTSPEQRGGKWNPEEFFASGAAEIRRVMQQAEALGLPRQRRSALDFGCGVGRLTRALAGQFERCVGVDIAESMLAQAREWHQAWPSCQFLLNTTGDLRLLQDRTFDLVYSNIVLQHLPTMLLIESYIRELIRVLAEDGLLIFQLPSHIPWKNRIQPRRRMYRLLRALGASERYLLNSLKLTPMRMNFMPEEKVRRLVEAAGGKVVGIERATNIEQMYYVMRS
jgi:ubiquinone/menaquinone biosynthesis C-methylase UbiE